MIDHTYMNDLMAGSMGKMVDYTTDYTPDSFGKSNAFDLRYNTNYSDLMGGTLNNTDIKRITGYTVPTITPNEHKSELLIDLGNRNLPPGINNEPGLYDAFIDNKIKNLPPVPKPKPMIDPIDKFWLEDPAVLFRNGAYYKIIPTKNMNRIQVLNALTRFFLYLGILYLLFGSDLSYMLIPIAGIIMILLLYLIQKWHQGQILSTTEPFDPSPNEIVEPVGLCQAPDKNNPFMNVTVDDLMENRNRPSACPVTNPTVRNQMEQAFNDNLFTDVEDVFDRKHSQRQFYTMPSTTIPNEQTEFAEWLYKAPETCKENQLNCLKYEDIRFNRFSPNIDRMERNEEDLD